MPPAAYIGGKYISQGRPRGPDHKHINSQRAEQAQSAAQALHIAAPHDPAEGQRKGKAAAARNGAMT